MPNLSRFITYGDRIFCYNNVTDRIVEVRLEDVPLVECPESVILDIVRENGRNDPDRTVEA